MAERCPAGPEQHWQLYGELKLHCRWVPNLVQEVVALLSQCVSLELLVLELLKGTVRRFCWQNGESFDSVGVTARSQVHVSCTPSGIIALQFHVSRAKPKVQRAMLINVTKGKKEMKPESFRAGNSTFSQDFRFTSLQIDMNISRMNTDTNVNSCLIVIR